MPSYNMTEINRCSYHPSRVATNTCQICHRIICLECQYHQQNYFRQRRGSLGKIVCPICYYDDILTKQEAIKFLIPFCFITWVLFLLNFHQKIRFV